MWLSNWYTRWLLVYYDRSVCATIHRLFDLDLDKIAYITNVHCVLVVSVSLTMTYHYMRLLHTRRRIRCAFSAFQLRASCFMIAYLDKMKPLFGTIWWHNKRKIRWFDHRTNHKRLYCVDTSSQLCPEYTTLAYDLHVIVWIQIMIDGFYHRIVKVTCRKKTHVHHFIMVKTDFISFN